MKKLFTTFVLFVLLCPSSFGSTVRMTFDDVDLPDSSETDIFAYGFRISPRCHLHVGRFVTDMDGKQLTGDSSGCLDPCDDLAHPAYRNCNYLGSPGTAARIDRPGELFSFLSVRFNAFVGTSIRSSTGEEILLRSGTASQIFDLALIPTSARWQNLEWIEITSLAGGLPNIFLDDLTFSVSEPSGSSLSVLAIAMAYFWRRKNVA